jgi:hypothetical protein
MRPLGFILMILGALGLVYFTFAFAQWHSAEMTRASAQILIIVTNDRVCGCITSGAVAITGALLVLTALVDVGITDFRRQLNDIHATFATANKETIEQNDDIIRSAGDLKRDRETRLLQASSNGED